ncbi:hypothetical protein OG749_36290 [Streptomyces nojiriensis]|uniref:hypothetical protein n=1 Tax=Streptomyces nojiriensis TaxID=66374 RepID=UPI002E178D9A
MARIQILELPEGAGDDRPPFILVIDEYAPERYITAGGTEFKTSDPFEGLAEKTGARVVLVFEETIEIPANDVPIGPDGYPLKLRIEGDFTRFREQVEEQIRHVEGKMTRPVPKA